MSCDSKFWSHDVNGQPNCLTSPKKKKIQTHCLLLHVFFKKRKRKKKALWSLHRHPCRVSLLFNKAPNNLSLSLSSICSMKWEHICLELLHIENKELYIESPEFKKYIYIYIYSYNILLISYFELFFSLNL